MTAETTELELRDALTHLYDPDHVPSAAIQQLTGCSSEDGVLAVQTAIIDAIESIRPGEDTPPAARHWQVYHLLRNRFVLKLTLEETAERMDTSFSSIWRGQRVAIHSLAQTLWSRKTRRLEGGSSPITMAAPSSGTDGLSQAADWQSQMERELASLRECAPNRVADVGQILADVLELAQGILLDRDLTLEVEHALPGLTAAVHPAVLRQALIAAIRRIAQIVSGGPIRLYAGLEDGNVQLTITGPVPGGRETAAGDLTDGIVVADGMSARSSTDGDRTFLWIQAPSVGSTTVLIVDDNPDMIRFYRRATDGTSYRIVHLSRGKELVPAAERDLPDIIVLDVMLPDIDGWQLLMRLRQGPKTRGVPVIVCTVVRERDLAMSLGAADFLTKPVGAREFTQALDRVPRRA